MSFLALNPITRECVDATHLAEPIEIARAKTYLCHLPDCEKPMKLRVYSGRCRAHFYHLSGCASQLDRHPETPEHREGVYALRSWLAKQLVTCFTQGIQREVPLLECKRVADLLVTFPCGWRLAIELQLSAITLDSLDARIQSYLRSGTDVLWFIGKSADTVAVRDLLASRYHFVPLARFPADGGVQPTFGYYRITEWPPKGVKEGFKFEATFSSSSDNRQDALATTPLAEILSEWFRDVAFLRYFAAWKNGDRPRFCRGLTAGDDILRSFAGRLGCANNKHAWKTGNLWTIDQQHFENYSSNVAKMDDDAIRAIRRRAQKKEQRTI